MVGVERFELPALWSQTRCATRLRYTPTLPFLIPTQVFFQVFLTRKGSFILLFSAKWQSLNDLLTAAPAAHPVEY